MRAEVRTGNQRVNRLLTNASTGPVFRCRSKPARYASVRLHMKTLREMEADVNDLAARIGASANDLPTYGKSRDFAYPHIEVDGELYHYVVVERGQEISRRSSANYDDLPYWIFSDATHNLAFDYELNNRIEDQDCRRIAFPKQIQLLGKISLAMADRKRKEIEAILLRAPYDDEATRKVNRMKGNAI